MSDAAMMEELLHVSEDVLRSVAELNLDYALAIDEDELERWPNFFVEGCLYRIVSRRDYDAGRRGSILICDSNGMLKDRVSAIRRVNVFEPHRYRHIVGSTKVIRAGDRLLETYTSFLVMRTTQHISTQFFTAGSYRDEIVFDGGLPKFKSRCVVCDSEAVDTLLSLPL